MIIKQVYYLDPRNNIEINDITLSKFNALVGVSGAGKTTIIRAIYSILKIATGAAEPADSWKISFVDDNGDDIEWEGKYSDSVEFSDGDDEETSEIEIEKLLMNGKTIIDRQGRDIIFNGKKLPVVDRFKSLLYTLRDDELIHVIHESLKSITIILNDSTGHSDTGASPVINPKAIEKIKDRIESEEGSLQTVMNQERVNCRERIYYAFEYSKDLFEEFLFLYTNIFPDVESIIPELKISSSSGSRTFHEDRSMLTIKIKMKSGAIINQQAISSGMFKTMMILSEVILGNKKSPIIIDEIENSLGINCLSEIIMELQASSNQVIMTTHHPQVIESIPPKYYRIVNRNGGKISAHPAERINGSSSHHDRFIQLINSSEYKGS